MPARVIAHPPHQASQVWILREELGDYVLGRDEDCDLVLEDDRISRRHLRFRYEEGWVLEDLGSKNGLWVDGERVERVALEREHWIDAGGVLVRFEPVTLDRAVRIAEDSSARWRSSQASRRELSPDLEPRELLDRLLRSVLRLAGLERGFVLVSREDGDHEVIAERGISLEDFASPRFRGSVGAVERTLAARQPMATTDASLDTWLGERASILTGGIRGLVCLPLAVGDDLLGVLYADSRLPGTAVTELDVEILSALADHAALVLSVSAMGRELTALEEVAGLARIGSAVEERSWRRLVGAAGDSP